MLHERAAPGWSPDGRQLAYVGSPEPTNPYGGSRLTGGVGVLDLGTGEAAALPGAEGAVVAAFAPGGTELAVQPADEGEPLRILSLDGGPARSVPVPAGHVLGGADSWSPDGRWLAVAGIPGRCVDGDGQKMRWCGQAGADSEVAGSLLFVDATGAGTPSPLRLGRRLAGAGPVLGWPAEDRLVLLVPEPPEDPHGVARHWVTEVPLDGGTPQRLAAVPTDDGQYGVGRFQLAGGLLPELEVRAAGDVDRGPWPLWLRLAAATALAGGAALVLPGFLRRRAG